MRASLAGVAALLTCTAALADTPPAPPVDLDVEIPAFRISEGSGAQPTAAAEVPVDAILGTSVYVVSRKPQLLRESPGVVTILSREELLDSGATDLIDVLPLVPGFFLGMDVQGTVGIGFRGAWGHEGKVLLLIDGQELNELSYSSLQLGNHYPIEHVERIEIIRGPGSALYGGFAELAVINVITRNARKLRGVSAALSYGQLQRSASAFTHRNLSLSAGDSWGDLSLTLAGQIGQGKRSDAIYTDVNGEEVDLVDDSDLDPRWINAGLAFRDLKLRFIYDGYSMTMRDAFGENIMKAARQHFTGYYAEALYELHLGERVTITPRLSFRHQEPWAVEDIDSDFYGSRSVDRLIGGLSFGWDIVPTLNLTLGVEAYQDHSYLNDPDTKGIGFNTGYGPEDANEVFYENLTTWGQLLLRHPIVNLTVGARYELHSDYGASIVPRLGLTKVMGRWHVKLLAAAAFRAPSIQNINLNADITPERTRVFEIEGGVQLSQHAFLSLNAFDLTIDDPIVYSTETIEGMEVEGYFNRERTGTRGGEIDFRMRHGWGYVNASGSFYTARGRSESPDSAVPGHEDALLGAPLLKVAVYGGFHVWKGLIVGPSVIFLSERYREDPEEMIGSEPAALLVHLHARYPDLGVKGLELGLGVRNLLDQEYRFVQPYRGGHPPWPGPSRELVVRLAYTREL